MPRYYVGKSGMYFGKRRYRQNDIVDLPDGMQPPPDAVLVKPPDAQVPQSPPAKVEPKAQSMLELQQDIDKGKVGLKQSK